MHQILETDDWDQYIDLENDEYLYKYSHKEMFAPSNISFLFADVEMNNPDYYFDDDYKPSYVEKRTIIEKDMEKYVDIKQVFAYMASVLSVALIILILS
jgi:hypothetical protein